MENDAEKNCTHRFENAGPSAVRSNQPTGLSFDISERIDSAAILLWIDEELDRLSDGWVVNPKACGELSFRTMVKLIVFALATNVYSSTEIVRRCHSSPPFRMLCNGTAPLPDELMSFRHKNRELIVNCLETVLLRAVRSRRTLINVASLGDLQSALRDQAVERLNIASHVDSQEE